MIPLLCNLIKSGILFHIMVERFLVLQRLRHQHLIQQMIPALILLRVHIRACEPARLRYLHLITVLFRNIVLHHLSEKQNELLHKDTVIHIRHIFLHKILPVLIPAVMKHHMLLRVGTVFQKDFVIEMILVHKPLI